RPPGQTGAALRQDGDGSEVPVRDHEARHLRRSHEVHGLIAIRAAALVQAAARSSPLAAQIASEPRSVRWITQVCVSWLSSLTAQRTSGHVGTFPATGDATADASLQESPCLRN